MFLQTRMHLPIKLNCSYFKLFERLVVANITAYGIKNKIHSFEWILTIGKKITILKY